RASLRAQRITMEAGRGTRRRAEDSAEGHEPAQHHHGVTHTISEFAQPVDQFQGASTVIPAQEALYRQRTSAGRDGLRQPELADLDPLSTRIASGDTEPAIPGLDRLGKGHVKKRLPVRFRDLGP